jgi:hypothetical protein
VPEIIAADNIHTIVADCRESPEKPANEPPMIVARSNIVLMNYQLAMLVVNQSQNWLHVPVLIWPLSISVVHTAIAMCTRELCLESTRPTAEVIATSPSANCLKYNSQQQSMFFPS